MIDKILQIVYVNEDLRDIVYTGDGFHTKYGIVFEKHRKWLAKYGCNSAEDITKYIRDIFYKEKFDSMNIDLINSFDLAYNVYDMRINAGSRTAGKLLQKCISRFYTSEKLVLDGIIGKKTIKALNDVFSCYGKESITEMYIEARQAKYFRILNKFRENKSYSDKKLMDFLESWNRRVKKIV